jgi:hypothetical protein
MRASGISFFLLMVLRLNLKKLLVISIITLLCLSVLVGLSPIPMVRAQTYNVQSVQGPITGEAESGTSLTVTLNSAPLSGDLLIAVIGGTGTNPETVDSITETGVSWTVQESINTESGFLTAIWAGVVSSGAVKGITVNFDTSLNGGAFAYVDEYSGLKTTGFLDKVNDAYGSATTVSTGTTATTSVANELVVGGIFGGEVFSSPTSGYAVYGNTVYDYDTMVYLSQVVSTTGAQSCSMTQANGYTYQGVIATFEAAAISEVSITFTSSPGTGSGYITVNSVAESTPYTISSAVVGATYNLVANTPANSVAGQTQYVFNSWTSTSIGTQTSASYTYTVPATGETVTAGFTEQYAVAITTSGISTDTSGTVVTLQGTNKPQSALPYSVWVNSGSACTYAFGSPIASTTTGKEYVWSSTSGLSQTGQSNSGGFTVSGYGTITGTYGIDYSITPSADSNSVISPSSVTWVNSGGNSQMFTYSANTGYTVASVLVDGSPVTIGTNYDFTNVQAPHSIQISSAVSSGAPPAVGGVPTTSFVIDAINLGTIYPNSTVKVNLGFKYEGSSFILKSISLSQPFQNWFLLNESFSQTIYIQGVSGVNSGTATLTFYIPANINVQAYSGSITVTATDVFGTIHESTTSISATVTDASQGPAWANNPLLWIAVAVISVLAISICIISRKYH